MAQALPDPLSGPEFGSYPPADVAWLMTDLSDLDLEEAVAEREADIQAGRRHYSESLPVEEPASAAYLAAFEAMMTERARSVAALVALLGERLLSARGPDLVLVSLARAGTPIGVLLRRYVAERHAMDVPHFAASVILGKGFDPVAAAWLREHVDPARVVFVDGWSGKGAIAREMIDSARDGSLAEEPAFNVELAVVADPGGCTSLYGTRDDLLIPSACLNATVSGLVSRTVHSQAYLRPTQFHGAKYYSHRLLEDRSNEFVEAIARYFPLHGTFPHECLPTEPPDWRGLAKVSVIARLMGTPVGMVKPGVCEATRVLLRRRPRLVVVRDRQADNVRHLLVLADEKGVEVREEPQLGFDAVGVVASLGPS